MLHRIRNATAGESQKWRQNDQKQIFSYGCDFVRDRRGSEVARTAAAVGHPVGKARRGLRPRGTDTSATMAARKAGHQQSPPRGRGYQRQWFGGGKWVWIA